MTPRKSDEGSSLGGEKAAQLLKLLEALGMSPPLSPQPATPKTHEFWNTQPVPKSASELASVAEDGPIHKEPQMIPAEPYKLPDGFSWCIVNIDEEQERAELYQLLNQNYVEDVDSQFRFDYPPSFLEWALKAPGWNVDWHVGIRKDDSKELVAFISAIPADLRVRSSNISSVEVNFLCLHKSLRARRMAPLLIKEVTRRVNLKGIFQALYTAGLQLPEPVSSARYFHRPLNYEKLLETGFTALPHGSSLKMMKKKYAVEKPTLKLREMRSSDIPACFSLFKTFMENFSLTPQFTEEEFAHWVLPHEGVLFCYVLEGSNGEVTDFVTFYSLPSSVLCNDHHKGINVAYLFYYATKDESNLTQLMQAALWLASEAGFDVFNALDTMKNEAFLRPLSFSLGDGTLHYYLFNWKTALLSPKEVAVAML